VRASPAVSQPPEHARLSWRLGRVAREVWRRGVKPASAPAPSDLYGLPLAAAERRADAAAGAGTGLRDRIDGAKNLDILRVTYGRKIPPQPWEQSRTVGCCAKFLSNAYSLKSGTTI
jgi:hypothetical protein